MPTVNNRGRLFLGLGLRLDRFLCSINGCSGLLCSLAECRRGPSEYPIFVF